MKIHRSSWAALAPTACIAVLSACGGYGSSSGYTPMMNLAPTASFSMPAQAATIHLGQSVALAWSSAYATSCTASTSSMTGGAFSGMVATSGQQTVAPTATGTVTYTLQCTGSGGMVTAHSQMITVDPSIVSGLSTITTIGSTVDPIEMGRRHDQCCAEPICGRSSCQHAARSAAAKASGREKPPNDKPGMAPVTFSLF